MSLTLKEANQIIEGAIVKAEELGIKINVAVCDDGGRLQAFSRMDGAAWAGMYGSQGKAVASAATGRASGELQERADAPIYRGIVLAEGGHMILSKGALPIIRAQEIIGACGVGGGTADEDEVCAAAGLAAISG